MKTKVRKDNKGLYFRTGGWLFRPQPTKYSYPAKNMVNGETIFTEGNEVNVRHIGGTPFGKITDGKTVELWHSHGMAMNNKGGMRKDTENIYTD